MSASGWKPPQEHFSKASRLVPPHAITGECPPRPEEPISNKSLAVAVPPSSPAHSAASWLPLLTDTLRSPQCPASRLKASDGAATAGSSLRPLVPLVHLSNQNLGAPRTKGGVCFFVSLFISGRVPACACARPLMCNTAAFASVAPRALTSPFQKMGHAEPSPELRNRRKESRTDSLFLPNQPRAFD